MGMEGFTRKMGSPAKPHYHGESIKYTCCATTQCLRNCVLKVRVRDGIITACEPDDTINAGIPRDDRYLSQQSIDWGIVQNRSCAKSYAKRHLVYDPDRVVYPLARVGQRGEGSFKKISWDEALDIVAKKLVETKEKYGPYSILHEPYTLIGYCSFPLAPWFGAGFAAWNAHSADGWHEPSKWVFGRDGVVDPGFYQDDVQIFNSKLIVLWGVNPLVTQPGGWSLNLVRARERGIPIICIEPRYTPSVEVLADQWIPIRPTTDVAMMIALANVWFNENLYDREFVSEMVEPEGFGKWKAYVLGAEDGVEKTPTWAEQICGVPSETIVEFARFYARSKPVNLNVSWSMGRQFYGENATRATMYLQAMTGNMCIPGGTAAAGTGIAP
ncbi:MAG: molybdopterin-dependent oxidoreductase, partial [Dehalococcoidia bacterium]